MGGNVIFYTYGSTLELNGQQLTAGMLTADLLNLSPDDYLRLKNITLGYTLPKSVSRFVGMENGSLRVYMSIDNVCTITGYSGGDPEVGNYGIDRGVYPVSRFFNFGVNINF